MNDVARNTAAVELQGLCKSYRRGSTTTPVLQDLSLSIYPGECTFLAGPSGSGKSTLLSIIGCILTAEHGSIRVFGENIQKQSVRERAALRLHRIGFVFQRFHLIRGLTAVENVCVPIEIAGASKRDARIRAMSLLEAFDVADKASSHPANLSTGQCQRIAIARALANEPDLILADEPTASLDEKNGQQVMTILRNLACEEDRSLLVVTHDTRIFNETDVIHWMTNGQLTQYTSRDSEVIVGSP